MKKIGCILEPVDDSTRLGQLLNMCMKSINTMRILSSPIDFENIGKDKTDAAIMFYESCLIEIYLHSVIDGLNRLKSIANEYNNKYEGNWKYYATFKRRDSIEEYGGNEDDYDAEGNITPATDEKLKVYSVVSDLQSGGSRDIFLTTTLMDLQTMFQFIEFDGRTCINDFFQKTTGKRLKTYTMKNGEMVENDWADEAISKSRREFESDELSTAVMTALGWVTVLAEKITELKQDEDNKDFFEFLPLEVDRILNLQFD